MHLSAKKLLALGRVCLEIERNPMPIAGVTLSKPASKAARSYHSLCQLFCPLSLLLICLFTRIVSAQITSQLRIDPAASVEQLRTCSEPREVVSVEEIPQIKPSTFDVDEAPLTLSPLVEDILNRSGCFRLAPNANIKVKITIVKISDQQTTIGSMFQMAPVGSIRDVRVIEANIIVSKIGDGKRLETQGTGSVLVQHMHGLHILIGPQGIPLGVREKNETYRIAFKLAVESAINKIIQ